jgi:nitrite reductase/ring-hydroxylating ferredoxin subunit
MGPASALLLDELGYDPDDGLPEISGISEISEISDSRGPGVRPDITVGDVATDIAIGVMIAARAGARRVAIARLGSGRLVVVDDECPHDGGRISDGFVDGERLICARHGWELEARNGRCERACKLRE